MSSEYASIAGGNSGNCIIDSTVAPVDGIYKFKVSAAGSQSVDSAEISVDIEAAVPTTPINYNRNDDSCTVTFTTAADGITNKVELYRSTEADFIADASTLSATLPIGPNQNGSIVDPNGNCNDYLYAIRAVSVSGAGSGFVGDTDVTVRTRTRTTTRTVTLPGEQVSGAIPVAAGTTGGVVAGEETTAGTGVEEGEGGAGNEGQVLGEETSTNETGGVAGLFEKVWPWLLLLIAAGLVWYGIAKRNKNESSIK
jgi:hypothetical protein